VKILVLFKLLPIEFDKKKSLNAFYFVPLLNFTADIGHLLTLYFYYYYYYLKCLLCLSDIYTIFLWRITVRALLYVLYVTFTLRRHNVYIFIEIYKKRRRNSTVSSGNTTTYSKKAFPGCKLDSLRAASPAAFRLVPESQEWLNFSDLSDVGGA
jgi:hypothetical protein